MSTSGALAAHNVYVCSRASLRPKTIEDKELVTETTKRAATGRIEVKTYEPRPYEEPTQGPNLVEIHVTETLSGDIDGEGVARFLQAVRDDGSASFVGIERVRGKLDGREGSFLLQDAGTLEGTTVKGDWFVIPNSGTGELADFAVRVASPQSLVSTPRSHSSTCLSDLGSASLAQQPVSA